MDISFFFICLGLWNILFLQPCNKQSQPGSQMWVQRCLYRTIQWWKGENPTSIDRAPIPTMGSISSIFRPMLPLRTKRADKELLHAVRCRTSTETRAIKCCWCVLQQVQLALATVRGNTSGSPDEQTVILKSVRSWKISYLCKVPPPPSVVAFQSVTQTKWSLNWCWDLSCSLLGLVRRFQVIVLDSVTAGRWLFAAGRAAGEWGAGSCCAGGQERMGCSPLVRLGFAICLQRPAEQTAVRDSSSEPFFSFAFGVRPFPPLYHPFFAGGWKLKQSSKLLSWKNCSLDFSGTCLLIF